MTATCYEDLISHVGHNIECVVYGDPPVNVAIECETCNIVLLDFDNPDEPDYADESWIDSHSVNCIVCGRLFDERDSVGTTDDGGDICPACEPDYNPLKHTEIALARISSKYPNRHIVFHVWSPADDRTNAFFSPEDITQAVFRYEYYIRAYGSARLYIDCTRENDVQDEHECVLAYDQEDNDNVPGADDWAEAGPLEPGREDW